MSKKFSHEHDGTFEISMYWSSISEWVLWKTFQTKSEALKFYHSAFDEWEWVPMQLYDRLHDKVIAERPLDYLHPIKVDENNKAWICVQNMIDHIEEGEDVDKVEYAVRYGKHIVLVKIHKDAYKGPDENV